MKSMMVLIRSGGEMLETAKRELPRKNPEKNKIKKRSTDDSEPPASGSPGAASPRIVFAPRARGSGIPGSRRHRLFGQRRGDRPVERNASQEKRAHRRAVFPGGGRGQARAVCWWWEAG